MPKTLTISKENAAFQVMYALKTNREKRNKLGFLIEGVRNINNAIERGWRINTFIYSSEHRLSDWAMNILKHSTADTHYDMSLDLMEKLSGKNEPSELLAIADIPPDDIAKIPVSENLLVVVFDRPASPGNLGAIIRSCDGMGASGLIVTGHATDVYDPETISATTGSLFTFPVVRLESQKQLLPWVEEVKAKFPTLQIVGADESGTTTIYDCDLTVPTIIVVGNEKVGLSAGYKAMVDTLLTIPMEGSASSLNVAVATSIILAEVKRQRLAKK